MKLKSENRSNEIENCGKFSDSKIEFLIEMTESNVNDNVIKQTQDSLGKFVKKPPLTEKLLKKPPFKFIHDIVKVVSI